MRKKMVTLFISAAVIAGTLFGCGSRTEATAEPEAVEESSEPAAEAEAETASADGETIITIARPVDSSNLDPIVTGLNEDIWVINLMLQGLTKSSNDGKSIEPCLAESWDISEDQLTYTFHIRKGLKFSDGADVTAEDWQYSLDRYILSEESPWRGMISMIDSATAVDDTTVEIKLNTISPNFLASSALFCMSVMPKAYCEKVGDEGISKCPVGTGPYYLKEWKVGESMTFAKNPYYWEAGLPIADSIIFNVVADDNTRIMQLQSGEVDAITEVPANRLSELNGMEAITVLSFDSTESRHITMNNSVPALSDPNVRMALLMATDRESIIQAVYYGNATISTGLIGPAQPYYNDSLEAVAYDLEGAKELLAGTDYAEGFDISLQIRSGNTNELQEATMLKEQWAKLGVNVNIEQLDASTVSDNWYSMGFEMMFTSLTSDTADTNQFATGLCIADLKDCYHTLWTGDKQKQAEELAVLAGKEMDTEKRAEMYDELQKIAAEENPILPLYYVPFRVATRSDISGFVQSPLGVYDFKELNK